MCPIKQTTNQSAERIHLGQWECEKYIWNRGANMYAHVHGTKEIAEKTANTKEPMISQSKLDCVSISITY